jgi:hypothetical protein
MRWRVQLTKIVWDVGDPDDYAAGYNPSSLPRSATVTVNADDEDEALQYGMSEIDSNYGSLIIGCDAYVIRVEDQN